MVPMPASWQLSLPGTGAAKGPTFSDPDGDRLAVVVLIGELSDMAHHAWIRAVQKKLV